MHTSTFHVSDYIPFADIPTAKESHMVNRKRRETTQTLLWFTGGITVTPPSTPTCSEVSLCLSIFSCIKRG